MAVKTIRLDMVAYRLLKAQRRPGESYSEVIKRLLRPECTAEALLEALPTILLSEDTLDRIEEIVRAREASMAESPVIDLGQT